MKRKNRAEAKNSQNNVAAFRGLGSRDLTHCKVGERTVTLE
jgi:hypothetical protein